MFAVLASQAQLTHSIYLSAAGDFAMLVDNGHFTTPKAGGGGAFGLGYELKHGHLLFNAGVEGGFSHMRSKVNDFTRVYDAVDTEGDPFKWNHYFYERLDEAEFANVSIPLMLGGIYDYVYFMFGPKLTVTAWGRSREKSLTDATGKYEGLIGGEFEKMGNHSLYNGRKLSDSWKPYSVGLNLRLAGEVGIPLNTYLANDPGDDILSRAGIDMRIGVFFEAGVLNLRGKAVDGDFVKYTNVDHEPGVDFTENYVFRASETANTYVTDILTGVRLTVSFRIPEEKICVICGDYYNY